MSNVKINVPRELCLTSVYDIGLWYEIKMKLFQKI